MRVQVQDQITVNVPASKVWRVLAHEFDNIGQWASGIAASKAMMDRPVPEGAKVGGRVCLSPGFGADATEAFTYYDEQDMRFGYEAIGELPWPCGAYIHWNQTSLWLSLEERSRLSYFSVCS